MLSFNVRMLGDINATPADSDPHALTRVGDLVFFGATDSQHGEELWVTDGSPTGTRLVKDITPGPQAAMIFGQAFVPTPLDQIGDRVVFEVHSDTNADLWSSDGTEAGTMMIFEGYSHSRTMFREELYFAAEGGIWKTDGGNAIVAFPIPEERGYVNGLTKVGDQLFSVVTGDSGNSSEIWRTDGSEGSPALVVEFSGNAWPLIEFDGSLFFVRHNQLWRTNRTLDGAVRIANRAPTSDSELVVVDDILFFRAVQDDRLYQTDGTSKGTFAVADFAVGTIHALGTSLIFTELDKRRLWATNGSLDGTVPISTENTFNVLTSTTVLDGELFFFGEACGVCEDGLWRTDGTVQGTQKIVDDLESTSFGLGKFPTTNELATIGNDLLFVQDGEFGVELWKTDRLGRTPELLKNIAEGTSSSAPAQFTKLGEHVIFTVEEGPEPQLRYDNPNSDVSGIIHQGGNRTGLELLQIGGKPFVKIAGAVLNHAPLHPIEEFELRPAQITIDHPFATDDEFLYFTSNSFLFRTDGLGTHLIQSLDGPIDDFATTGFVTEQGSLIFSVMDFNNHHTLWISDGTRDGGVPLLDGLAIRNTPFAEREGQILFAAENDDIGAELWMLNLASQDLGPFDINNGESSSHPDEFIEFNDKIFFVANDRERGRELWIMDDSLSPQRFVDIRSGQESSNPHDLLIYEDELYFVADDGMHGEELWKTDGTPAGTQLVQDIRLGTHGSAPGELVVLNDQLFFRANDGVTGMEIWSTDGTRNGAELAADIRTGEGSSWPESLTVIDDSIYFSADDGEHGREAWVLQEFVGDLDGDNLVGFSDFLILSANFGQTVESTDDGDLDEDGTVGFADFLLLSANFGRLTP